MRDDFPEDVKRKLGHRVGWRCSNPACQQSTSGPSEASKAVTNVGVAAHITAASPDGPRYDASQTPKQRGALENGVWLCQKCGKAVDDDPVTYTCGVLRDWKSHAEARAREAIEQGPRPQRPAEVNASHCEGYLEHPTAKEIDDQISGLPPYQRLGAAENYTGLKVRWKVTLVLVHPRDGEVIEISCKDASGYSRYVMSEVSLRDYPRLKSSKRGECLWICGEILGMEPSGFVLATHRLEFGRCRPATGSHGRHEEEAPAKRPWWRFWTS